MSTLVSSLITQARARINETSTTFHTEANLIAYANESQKYVVRETKCLEGSSTSAVVSGTQDYALPSDLLQIRRITFDGIKLFPINFVDLDEAELDETDITGAPANYFIWNDSIYLYPIPGSSDAGKYLKIFYYKAPVAITASTDAIETKPVYDDVIVAYMTYLALVKDSESDLSNLDKADYMMSECNAKLLAIKSQIKEKDLSSQPRRILSENIKSRDPLYTSRGFRSRNG
jgi:hypothetical protein